VSVWSEVFLGIIAVAMLAIAVVQIGVLVAAGRAISRVTRLVDHTERELQPLLGHLNAIGRDAARAAAVAASQVDRVDALFADLARRIEQMLDAFQASLAMPAREARAVLRGFRVALQTLRDVRDNGRRRRGRAEDEDALFI
jgi:uncharacterized protein YoxC